MKKLRVILLAGALLIIFAESAWPQFGGRYSQPEYFYKNSFFILLGYSSGPHFEKFVNWANEYYYDTINSTDSIGDFKGSFDFSAGLRIRFSHHFAGEFDFLTYTLKTKQAFVGTGQFSDTVVNHNLDLNVAIFSASILVLLDFQNKQPIIPFAGTGISVFPMRLDHSIDYSIRHVQTALAANFTAGIDIRISQELSGSIRGDWTFGTTNMPVSPIYGEPESFKMDLSTTQIQAGIMYGFN
ncbi:MAG: hypothetical protein J7K40_06305 [candidate division Zixibacteria bacterium]|nr:hypothetical protein [candidate division Zixibacteria bacterium]